MEELLVCSSTTSHKSLTLPKESLRAISPVKRFVLDNLQPWCAFLFWLLSQLSSYFQVFVFRLAAQMRDPQTQGRKRQVSSSSGKTSCIYPPSVPGYVSHTKSFNFTTFISFHLYAFVIPINLPSCAVIYWHLPSTTFINPHIPLSTFIVQVLRSKIVQINDTRMKLSQIVKGPKGNIFWCRAKPN